MDINLFSQMLCLYNNLNCCSRQWFYDPDYSYSIKVVQFDLDGNLIKVNDVASRQEDSLLYMPLPIKIEKVGNSIYVSGDCYYAKPSNPNVGYLRPMFIKIDSILNKEWFLPFGTKDQIFGTAFGILPIDQNLLRGYGRYGVGSNVSNSILMDFDVEGTEQGFIGIPNSSLAQDVVNNELRKMHFINDSVYMCTGVAGNETSWTYPIADWIMDKNGIVTNYQNHLNTTCPIRPSVKTYDNKYVTIAALENETTDILLYKLNSDLSQAANDTTTYNYDSLCDNLPIVSDTIYIDNCSIVTGLEDYEDNTVNNNNTIALKAYPSPARNSVTIEYEEDGDFTLKCYNMLGKQVYTGTMYGENTATININSWKNGMYVAVVSGRDGKRGIVKFVVQDGSK